jgi:hypothetical protein
MKIELTAEQIEMVVATELVYAKDLLEVELRQASTNHEDAEYARALLDALDFVISYYTVQE